MGVTAGQAGQGGEAEHCVGDRYRLVEGLGRGGMGSVWQAFDERLQRSVAVKMLDPSQSPGDQGRVEALVLAQLNHPHIANVFDYGEDEGQPYLVMELVRGQSLATILGGGPLGWSAAAAAAAHVASALAAAHERGVVHRDVKPENIMVTPVGAKLIDFGISAVEGDAEADADGGIRGTPAYVAPERLHGHAVAATADVYALGVVLYRALSGHLPWRTGDTIGYLTERERTDPAPLSLAGGLPPAVADLCLQCLAVDHAHRPDAATVARVLTEAAGADGVRTLERLGASRAKASEATQLMAPVSMRGSQRDHRSTTVKAGAVAAVVAAAVLALALSTASWDLLRDDIPQTINSADGPAPPACEVTFRVAADDGRRFAADIIATPRTESFQSGWRLSLPLPTDGIDVDQTSGWTRKGAVLTSPAQPTLGVGSPSQLAFSGSHTAAIALPTTMSVDGRDCAVELFASTTATGSPPSGNGDDQASDRPESRHSRPTPPTGPGNSNGNGRGQDSDDG
jgi:eukaryotic-like serine/threonine-protein kinase